MLLLPYMQGRTWNFIRSHLGLYLRHLYIFFLFTFVVEWVSYDFTRKIFRKQTQKKKFLHLVLKIL